MMVFQRKGALCAALFALLLLCAPAVGGAQEESEDGRATSFRAVEGSEAEEVDGGALMLGAYGAAWLFVFAYVFRLGRMQRATEAGIRRLEESLDASSGVDGA